MKQEIAYKLNETNTFFTFLSIFLLIQFLGLYVGNGYIQAIKTGEIPPIVENPEDVSNSFIFFFWVLVAAGIILLIVKFKREILRILEVLVIFLASNIVFSFLFPSFGFIFSLLIIILKIFRPSILTQNAAFIFSVAGAGAILGASLGVFPVIVFMILLSIYDLIAVFYTKHMIYMARAIGEMSMAFTLAVPCKFGKPKNFILSKTKTVKKKIHTFQMGGGDIVIPLTFSVSVLNSFGIIPSLFSILGATVASSVILKSVINKPKAIPALPPITIGTIIGFLIGLLL